VVLLGLFGVVCQLATAFGRVKVCVATCRLSVVEADFLGTRGHEWDRDQVAAIRASIEPRFNAKSLVVQSRDGSRKELLDHCPADDLKWVAALLRDALGVPAAQGQGESR
jgi:hypothetical protein